MNILIIGSTSGIGQSVTKKFSKGNHIILLGRSINNLIEVKKKAIQSGALNVSIINCDLSLNVEKILKKINKHSIDIIINMASTTSSLRDELIDPKKIQYDANVDFISPVLIVNDLLDKGNKLKLIFITSILSRVKSLDRNIYSSLKVLQETYLHKITKIYKDQVCLLTVIIGQELDKKIESNKSKRIAQKIFKANLLNYKVIYIGILGKIFLIIYNLNPFLFKILIKIKRLIIPFNI